MSKGKMCPVHKVAAILVLIGALNWGLVGGFGLNLVNSLLGSMPTAEKAVYILVGLSALMMLTMGKCKKCCGDGCNCKEGSCACGTGEQKM